MLRAIVRGVVVYARDASRLARVSNATGPDPMSQQVAALVWPAALSVAAMLVVVGGLLAWFWLFAIPGQRQSRQVGLLREAAHAQRRRLELIDFRLVSAAVALALTLFLWCVLSPAGFASADYIGGTVVYLAVGLAALAWPARELIRYGPERPRLRRAVDAQARAAVHLNLLMRQKYWVFHDVHIGGHRINHVAIGDRGVFCVESLWRRSRGALGWTGRQPPPKAEVVFDGDELRFPGWSERDVLGRVEHQVRSLGPWLAAEVGEPEASIPVFGAIALPGWQVTSTDWKRLLVFNPSTPKMLVEGAATSRRLDPTTKQALLDALKRGQKEITQVGVRY